MIGILGIAILLVALTGTILFGVDWIAATVAGIGVAIVLLWGPYLVWRHWHD